MFSLFLAIVLSALRAGDGKILCDTTYECKQKVAMNTLKCCKICPNALYVMGEKGFYGFYEHLEQDSNGLSQSATPTDRAVAAFGESQKRKFQGLKAEDKNINPSIEKELMACSMPANDDFKLPCCMPCVGPYQDEEDLENKNAEQPINGFAQRPQGPVLVAEKFDDPTEVPCCASGMSSFFFVFLCIDRSVSFES